MPPCSGFPAHDAAAWALPGSYAVVAVIGAGWALLLKARHPDLYAAVGLGARAATARLRAADLQGGRPR